MRAQGVREGWPKSDEIKRKRKNTDKDSSTHSGLVRRAQSSPSADA